MADKKRWDIKSVRQALIGPHEIAFLDVREEHFFAQAHPLWAANVPLSTLEAHVRWRVPRLDTPIVVYGRSEGWTGDFDDLATLARQRLVDLGYLDVNLLDGGLEGWRRAGGELFSDVNVPSKAFGEFVEHELATPSLSAFELQKRLGENDDIVIVDVRTFPEYRTMSIPGGVSVPGGEAVLRIGQLVRNNSQTVVVNCAGRTRSIIGAQSLINAGLTNPVFALRNGTMGWLLNRYRLSEGASEKAPNSVESNPASAQQAARFVADQAGVGRLTSETFASLRGSDRTVYVYDVRSPEEYQDGHLLESSSAPGGQLVQETDWYAPVRGAHIVLIDDDGVRANMTGSWLAQMGWKTHVIDGLPDDAFSFQGAEVVARPSAPDVALISAHELQSLVRENDDTTRVIDLSSTTSYTNGHIPGAWYLLRARLVQDVAKIPLGLHYVLTSNSGYLARFAAKELEAYFLERGEGVRIRVLDGGTKAWTAAGFAIEDGNDRMVSSTVDRFARPYNGIRAQPADMQAYLDWELGLVAQLERDGTHNFHVIRPELGR